MKFIDQIANYIEEKELELSNLVIILPSVRARKYLEQALVNKAGKPIFAPEITTIDRWVKNCSTFLVQDRLALIMELYKVHLELLEPEEDASFDAFFNWVPQLLSDFDELEKYLVDAQDLFKNLRDVREIERWSPDGEPLTEAQENYLKFWDRLQYYYARFKENLGEKNWGYNGMAFRQVAEKIDLVFKISNEKQFLFAGFNALSLAEMSIMKQLVNRGCGHVLIDADAYYLNNDYHEAGYFLRELQSFLGLKEWPHVKDKIAKESKKVVFVECAQNIAQVNVASTTLSRLSPKEIEKTLLLLADESLVLPMIKNLPLNIGKANITMGLELRNTSVKLWVDILFSIQENKERFSSKDALYHKDLSRLWKHPFFQQILPAELQAKQLVLEEKVIAQNSLFKSLKSVNHGSAFLEEFYQILSENWASDWNIALLNFRKLNQLIFEVLSEESTFEKAIIKAFDNCLMQFSNSWNAQEVAPMGRRIFKQLFQLQYGSTSIAYEGNPISGLQIMGLLETRLLDFERIICLGMNEGNMPPGNPIQTLIPMDLRAHAGMPTNREKNGLFAHHFYRLLHDVKDLTITYLNRREDMMSNEASRYLLQMELELTRENPNLQLEKIQYQLDASAHVLESNVVEKTPFLLQKLDRVLARSLSASAISKWIHCELDFYYRYLLEFGEEEEVEEEMQNNTFGTILHDILETMYTPFVILNQDGVLNPKARYLEPQDIVQMKARVDDLVLGGFKKTYDDKIDAFQSGKNYLSFEMAKKLLHRFLDDELKRISTENNVIWIFALEQKLQHTMHYSIYSIDKKAEIRGTIDRIEIIQSKNLVTSPVEIMNNLYNERLRVVDYKSGKVDAKNLVISEKAIEMGSLIPFLLNKDNKYAVQLLFYAYLIKQKWKVLPSVLSIVSFISYPKNGEGLNLNFKECSQQEVLKAFEIGLIDLISIMYEDTRPFKHTADEYNNYCSYCE